MMTLPASDRTIVYLYIVQQSRHRQDILSNVSVRTHQDNMSPNYLLTVTSIKGHFKVSQRTENQLDKLLLKGNLNDKCEQ